MISMLGITIVLYFIKIFSGSRNLMIKLVGINQKNDRSYLNAK